MIVEITIPAHGDKAARCRWVPLAPMRQTGKWLPLDSEYKTAIGAARACLASFLVAWQAIYRKARLVRALCMTPAFRRFEADGIDGLMIAKEAETLVDLFAIHDENATRLLDGPRPDDELSIFGTIYRMNAETGELEPADPSASPADIAFMRDIQSALQTARAHTGHLSEHVVSEAVLELLAMRDGPPETPTIAPTQDMADRLYVRHVAAMLPHIYQQYGLLVSESALQDAARIAGEIRVEQAGLTAVVATAIEESSGKVVPFERAETAELDGTGDEET